MNKTPDLSEPNAVNIAYIAGAVFTVITCVAVGLSPYAMNYVMDRRRARAAANERQRSLGPRVNANNTTQTDIELGGSPQATEVVSSPSVADEVITTIPVTNRENPVPSLQPVIVDLSANPNPGPSSANITAQLGISGARI